MFSFIKKLKTWWKRRKIKKKFSKLFEDLSPLERRLWKQKVIRLRVEDDGKSKPALYAIVALKEFYERRREK